MTRTLEPITLVATDPSGAVLVLQDRDGQLWLHPPEGAGVPRRLDEGAAEQVIARQGLDRVDREFPGWGELEDFRQRHAAEGAPDVTTDAESLDADDVARLVDVAARWVSDGERDRARGLVVRLLRVPAAREADATYERLVALLEQFETSRPALRSVPETQLQADARARFELPRAA